MVQVSKVSFEYVDFNTKISLILDAAFGNQKTKRTLMFTIGVIQGAGEIVTQI